MFGITCSLVLVQAYDKDFNSCKSLIGDKLTLEQENWMKLQSDKSEIAKERFKLEKADDINPVRKITLYVILIISITITTIALRFCYCTSR